ncbi:hypothetical protein Scep_013689 [Stephania cephalantha]|uniref:Protein kinase domain-containing protein n=1 Tax=Stephania cephalantha TaxID=152367 RepID=A0AAP0IZX8_9MAGN
MNSSSSCAHHPFRLCSILMLSWSSMLIMTTTSSLTTSHGNQTDQLALLAFKSQISRDPLQTLDSWNSTIHFCQWHGVTCGRRHQRVVMLILKSHGFTGSLSPYIGNLSFLRFLNLDNNSFHGEIPSEVGSLFRLRAFRLANNSFTGEIPSNLSSNLKILSLGYNMLSGTVPNELGCLHKLEYLSLYRNNLTAGEIPDSLGNLTSLRILYLMYNNLIGRIPESLGQLKNLQILGLSVNMLSSTIPPPIYNITSLQYLEVTSNQIFGKLPSNIGLTLPNLRDLLMGDNHFFGSIPRSLFNISTLEVLDCSSNAFLGPLPTNVESLPNLRYLLFYDNRLGSFGKVDDLRFLSSFVNSTNLQVLDVTYNQLGGILHKSFTNISSTKLQELYLGLNQISGIIPPEIEQFTNLNVLNLPMNLLTGSIPQSIGKLNKLRVLHLQENMLSGLIPLSLNNLSQLIYLNLSYNNLEGHIIPDTSNFQSLELLDLSANKLNGTVEQIFAKLFLRIVYLFLEDNSFTGSLPSEVGKFEDLVIMEVSNNKLSGEIPCALGKCLSLQKLSLKGNSFQGLIPPSFSSLQGVVFLDLSLNNFSGEIPLFLHNLSFSLQYLNLSFNNFEGAVPTDGVFRNLSLFSILGNKKLCGGISKLQLPTCPDKQKDSKKHQIPLYLKVLIGVILSAIVIAALLLLLCWLKKPKKKSETQKMSLYDHYEKVSFLELHRATDGFSPANSIGTGHFGSVFKAIIREGTEPVAVKVLNMIDHKASKSFMAECEALRNVRHRNLMKILTACSTVDFQGNDFKALIFKFMPNGSLEKWLHPSENDDDERYLTENLSLSRRLNIAIDVASALDYLHNQCETPIVHCDLKPSNILLDEDMVAHVGDFGLAKFLQRKNSNSGTTDTTSSFSPRGTIGYIPPGTNFD